MLDPLDPLPFAEDTEAQDAFLAVVAASPGISIRDALRDTLHRRSEVKALIAADEEFADRYREARGYGHDMIRQEIRHRAFAGPEDPASSRLLLALAKAELPEYRDRIDATLSAPDAGAANTESRSTSLAAVFAVLVQAGALLELGVGAAGELVPAPRDVLAEPADG